MDYFSHFSIFSNFSIFIYILNNYKINYNSHYGLILVQTQKPLTFLFYNSLNNPGFKTMSYSCNGYAQYSHTTICTTANAHLACQLTHTGPPLLGFNLVMDKLQITPLKFKSV